MRAASVFVFYKYNNNYRRVYDNGMEIREMRSKTFNLYLIEFYTTILICIQKKKKYGVAPIPSRDSKCLLHDRGRTSAGNVMACVLWYIIIIVVAYGHIYVYTYPIGLLWSIGRNALHILLFYYVVGMRRKIISTRTQYSQWNTLR